jgi:hypothetical protein
VVIGIAVLAVLAFIGWLIVRAITSRSIKAHYICYGLSIVTGIFTYGYLLTLDYPQLIKIIASIVVGIVLIVFGALYQRRKVRR